MAFTGLKAAGGSWGGRHHQGPSGINALVKTNCLSRKKFPALDGLHRPQGRRRVLGGQTPSGTIGDQCFGQNKLFEPEKTSGLGWPSPASRLIEGPGGGQTPSGTMGDQRFGQNEPFEPEKISGLGWPSPASRPLEGPGGARHHQGPSGINAEVKRNQLSQKKNSASVGLGRPQVASGNHKDPGGAGCCQGPSGIDADVKRNQLSPKKFRPQAASGSLGRPQGPGRGPDTVGDHRGSMLRSKGTV